MTTMSVWEPMREFARLSQAMDRMLGEPFGQMSSTYRNNTSFLPIDVYMTENEVVIAASLPGLKPEDVEINYEGNTVTIRGEFKPPVGNVQWAIQERPYGKFSRTLTLNVPLDPNKADAVFENGVLTLTLPKAEWAKPRQIPIRGQQPALEQQPA